MKRLPAEVTFRRAALGLSHTLLTELLVTGGFTASWQLDYDLNERRLDVTHDISCRTVIGAVKRYMSVTNHALTFAASEDT